MGDTRRMGSTGSPVLSTVWDRGRAAVFGPVRQSAPEVCDGTLQVDECLDAAVRNTTGG